MPLAKFYGGRGWHFQSLKRFFLNPLPIHFKKIKFILISLFICSFIFSTRTFAADANHVSQDLHYLQKLKKDYYRGKPSRLTEAVAVFDKYEPLLTKENLTKIKNADVLLAAIRSAEAVSCYLAVHATEYRTMSKLFEAEKSLKRYLANGKSFRQFGKEERTKILLAFSDYLFSQITWNTKRVEVIMHFPIWYRKVLLLEPKNFSAKLKLVSWYSHSTTYAYPRQIQWLQDHESYFANMPEIDRFNAYVDYSMFYMRTLETQKAFKYLSRAREIFANNPYAQMIEDFYVGGEISFY